MAETPPPNDDTEQATALKAEISQVKDSIFDISDVEMMAYVYYLSTLWADFQICIIDPLIKVTYPPQRIMPQPIEDSEFLENVFPIIDEGFRLSTSRGEQGLSLGMSQLKFYNTIEKIVGILINRLREAWGDGGEGDAEPEARVAFYGHELGQRKAFESVMNLKERVIVTNYNGGAWADRFMNSVIAMVERGYGAPHESPRKIYPGPDALYPGGG